jgi:hypothetical protein
MNDTTVKWGLFGGGNQCKGRAWKEKVKGGKYDRSISHACIETE